MIVYKGSGVLVIISRIKLKSIERGVFKLNFIKIILKAVDSLPAKLRQVVVWYEFEELSYEQIAKKTGVPVGTVKSRLFHARKILSEKLVLLKENINE